MSIVRSLLAVHLPPRALVYAYGSRASGRRLWHGSDLDLMIKAGEALELGVLARLGEALSDSLVPFTVDLHDWHRTGPDFLARIDPDLVQLTLHQDPGSG